MISLAASREFVTLSGGDTPTGRQDVKTEPGRLKSTEDIWVCLHFPRIALDVFNPPEGIPFAVIEEIRGRQVIHTPCEVALAQGIMPGMPLNAAHVLCNNLSARLRDLAGEQKELGLLAERVTRFTPKISPSLPDALLLEVSGSLRLFGGFDRLYDLLHEEFNGKPLISSASSPAAALLLARNGMEKVVHGKAELKSVLGEIGIEDAGLPSAQVQQLSKCGLQTLRDLWRLSRPDLARRFGKELITFLDKVCGTEPDPGKRVIIATRFFHQIELPIETDDSKLLLIAAEKLFEKARQFLHSRASATEKMTFKLWHSGSVGGRKRYSSLVIRSQQADRHPQRFLPQFREKIQLMEMASPVDRISLRIDQVLPYHRDSEDLFDHNNCTGNADHQDWQQLMDILDARLGVKMVYCVGLKPDHRPERAWRRDGASRKQWSREAKQQPPIPLRPLWLLDNPRKTLEQQFVLHLSDEIERIENGWWDGNGIRRDYSIAVTPAGSRCWVFRDINGTNDFYMHGLYG